MTKIEDAVSNASGVAGVIAAVPAITSHAQYGRNQVSTRFPASRSLDAKGELEGAFKDASSCTTRDGSWEKDSR